MTIIPRRRAGLFLSPLSFIWSRGTPQMLPPPRKETAFYHCQPPRHSPVLTAVSYLAAGTLCFAGTALSSLFFGQRRLIWVGQRVNGAQFEAADPPRGPNGGELIYLSDEHVGLYFNPKDKGTGKTIVYFHGNGDQLGYVN